MDRRINPHLITIIAVLVLAILSIGSASRQKRANAAQTSTQQRPATEAAMNINNWGTFGEMSIMPVKDFEVKGWVYSHNEFRVDGGVISGPVFTYHELLQKANELGADAIINVTIDKVNRRASSATYDIDKNQIATQRSSSRARTEEWFGTALAIKYTTALTDENLLVNSPRRFIFSSGAYVSE